MTTSATFEEEFADLEARLRVVLPEPYQECYETVEPVSMGSAGLKFGADGRVAWDEMWGSFCDLAMAGGPPHKGTLLEPGLPAEIAAEPERYSEVVAEIVRGIGMVTELPAEASPHAGWVRVRCRNEAMSGWLVRAILMENVSARVERTVVELPAGPGYRLEKEIKNVVTAVAKTTHYYMEHMRPVQHLGIASLLARMESDAPLIQPAPLGWPGSEELGRRMAAGIGDSTGLAAAGSAYAGWLGVEIGEVRTAIGMMRVLTVLHVLARREGTVLFVPIDPRSDPGGEMTVQAVAKAHRFAAVRK